MASNEPSNEANPQIKPVSESVPQTNQQPTIKPSRPSKSLYHTENRAGFAGGVLQQNAQALTPEMLAQNLRAGLFPEKGQQIRNTIENGLIRSAYREVDEIESLYKSKCPHSCVKKIQIIQPSNKPSNNQSKLPSNKQFQESPIITDYQYPLITRVFSSIFAEKSIPHLTVFTPNSLLSPLPDQSNPSNNQSSEPAVVDEPVQSYKETIDPVTGSSIVEHEPRVIGTELWTIDRCSVNQSYIVQYVSDGDAFYSSVYPTNVGGAVDYMRIKMKRWLGLR